MSGSNVGAVYRRVADEHREAIELARRIVATPLEYGENRMAGRPGGYRRGHALGVDQ